MSDMCNNMRPWVSSTPTTHNTARAPLHLAHGNLQASGAFWHTCHRAQCPPGVLDCQWARPSTLERTFKFLARLRLSPTKHIGTLTERQLLQIVNELQAVKRA